MCPKRPTILFALLAATTLQACALSNPNPARLEKKADASLSKGDTTQAIKLLDGVVRSGEASPARYMQLGSIYRSFNTITGRLRSQRVLELGLQRFPDHPGLWLEMGKTNYDQTFYGDAARCFKRVLELDPGHCEAHLYLGINWFRKWKYVQVYTEYLSNAVPYLEYVAECDPGNRIGDFRLAFAKYALSDTVTAISLCERFALSHPGAPEGYFLRGAIAYQQSDYALCDSLFVAALSLLPEEEKGAMLDIALLLNEDDVVEYEFSSGDKRIGMQRVFWAERDPDPTTPLNERYLEHIQRMFLADAFFDNESPRLRGWETERGIPEWQLYGSHGLSLLIRGSGPLSRSAGQLLCITILVYPWNHGCAGLSWDGIKRCLPGHEDRSQDDERAYQADRR
jgi:GWxTD domain-containing protein